MKMKETESTMITTLRYILKSEGITQVELAHELGVPQETVSRWMQGHFRPSPLSRSALQRFMEKKTLKNVSSQGKLDRTFKKDGN